MELYSQTKEYKLFHGNMLDLGEVIKPCSIDAVLTDPPYELNFMGKGWDNSGIAFQPDTWKRCLEALKPGGYLLAFGGSRTYHRIACAIEDAGFEIRDCIMWLYGSGFPKSMDIGKSIDKKNGVQPIGRKEPTGGITGGKNTGAEEKGWHSINNWYEYPDCTNERAGWGTALKPSYEPIIVARKPLEGSCTDNVIKYGVGGINIDECRVPNTTGEDIGRISWHRGMFEGFKGESKEYKKDNRGNLGNRFPANTILTYGDDDREEVCSGFPNSGKGNNKGAYNYAGREYDNSDTSMFNGDKPQAPSNYNDNGSASRYFYCAKASKRDRDEGLDGFETKKTGELQGGRKEGSAGSIMQNADGGTRVNPYAGTGTPKKNIHPTVKPCDLMQYLVRLVTPNGGTVLDPFNGSGSTGKAVMYENKDRNKNYKYIGIELTDEYLPIAKARIEYVINKGIEKEKSDPKQEEQTKQRKESALF